MVEKLGSRLVISVQFLGQVKLWVRENREMEVLKMIKQIQMRADGTLRIFSRVRYNNRLIKN